MSRLLCLGCMLWAVVMIVLLSTNSGFQDLSSSLVPQQPRTPQATIERPRGSEEAPAPAPAPAAPAPAPSFRGPSASDSVKWVGSLDCDEQYKERALSCDAVCANGGLVCNAAAMTELRTKEQMGAAVLAAGSQCKRYNPVQVYSGWDGPWVSEFTKDYCAYSETPEFQASCTTTTPCGYSRLCACSRSPDKEPRDFTLRTFKDIPAHYTTVADRVPMPPEGDWDAETRYLEALLRVAGRLHPKYKGPQKLRGMVDDRIFNGEGMFNFNDQIKSIVIDVGAASNPMDFELSSDPTQFAFWVEPLQWMYVVDDSERNAKRYGPCVENAPRRSPTCVTDRALLFPAAVSSKLTHLVFQETPNPFCGSLESFKVSEALRNHPDKAVRDVVTGCYEMRPTGSVKIATISLEAVLKRVPPHIRIKYMKIDAQGHDYKVLLSAGSQIHRIEYVRFEMQDDPPEELKVHDDVPAYSDVESGLRAVGLINDKHACYLEDVASVFSKVVKESECVFCRKPPCRGP